MRRGGVSERESDGAGSAATAAVAGQNLGAGKPDRTAKSVNVAAGFGLMLAAGIGVTFILIPELLLGIFGMDDNVVLEIAVELLRYLAVSGLFITVALAYTGGLQGTGDTKSPMFISIICVTCAAIARASSSAWRSRFNSRSRSALSLVAAASSARRAASSSVTPERTCLFFLRLSARVGRRCSRRLCTPSSRDAYRRPGRRSGRRPPPGSHGSTASGVGRSCTS